MGWTELGGSSAYASFTPKTDITTGDSDKEIALSATRETIVQMVRVVLTKTVTVGDRQIVVEMRDSDDLVLAEARAGVVQVASTGPFIYDFGVNLPRLSSFVDTSYTTCTLPQLNLPAGSNLRIRDNNTIGGSLDLMLVYVTGIEKAS